MISELEARVRLERVLGELLGTAVPLRSEPRLKNQNGRTVVADFEARVGRTRFLVEWKANGTPSAVQRAMEQILPWRDSSPAGTYWILGVPWMSMGGREACQRLHLNWVDLAGNARIEAPGIKVRVEGHPPPKRPRGRPRNVLAPKSARLARLLLKAEGTGLTQRELSRAAGLDEGFTSRVLRRLMAVELVRKDKRGRVSVIEPWKLAEAWRASRDPLSLVRLEGHVDARTGEELLTRVSKALAHCATRHAATGLGAAWLHARFSGFRLVTIYTDPAPDASWLSALGFVADAAGANVWLMVPDDESAWQDVKTVSEVPCVSPIQTWLDLKEMPERSEEAATSIARMIEKGWSART